MPVARYWIEVVNDKETYKVPIISKNGKKIDKLTIEQIDYMTSSMKDKSEFLTNLLKEGFLQTNATDVYIAYNAKESKQKTDLIFNSKLLRECSIDSLNKKSHNVTNPLLERTNLLNTYIKQLKFYMFNPTSLNSIKRSKVFPYYLKHLILDYVELDEKPDKSPVVYADMSEIMRSIENDMCKYTELRKVILWEKKYLYNLEKVKEKNPKIDNQIKMVDYITDSLKSSSIDTQRKKDLEEAREFLEKMKEETIIDSKKFDDIHNGIYINDPNLKQYILEHFSIDEINTDVNISDKIINLLGIDKVKSLSDEELYSLGFDVKRFRQDYCDEVDEFRGR